MINEGLIKVPSVMFNTIYTDLKELIIGRLLAYYEDEIKGLSDEDIDILLDDITEYVNKFKKQYRHSDYTVTKYNKKYVFGKEGLTIPNYPNPPDKIELDVKISFNNKKRSASFVEVSPTKAIIKYNCTTHFKLAGIGANDNPVYTFERKNFDADLRQLKPSIRHELMHLVQILYIEKEQSTPMVVDYYDGDEIDIVKYLKSDIEFSPYLQSEIGKFMDAVYYDGISNSELKAAIREFVSIDYNIIRSSAYFNVLKNYAPTKYKKAVKIFFTEVQDRIKKGA